MRRLTIVALVLTACTASSTTTTADSTQPSGVTQLPSAPASSAPVSGLTCWAADSSETVGQLLLTDVTDSVGLVDPLKGMHGHTAIWTDVDGDQRADLYVGSYADRPDEIYQQRGAGGASPDRLLRLGATSFDVDDSLPESFSRSSGGVTADLDGDGDLDLVVSRNIKDESLGQPPTMILENDGGRLRPVEEAGIPSDLGGRSVATLDYDGDGLTDLFIAEDRFAGGSSVLLRNVGDLTYEDVTAAVGIPVDVHGLGVAAADFDHDGHHDIFVAGSNRLFLADGDGNFAEGESATFQWETYGPEDDIAGISVADVNRDGLLDIALGHHYNSTVELGTLVSVRLYLNEGEGSFVDVTEAAGLTPLPTKAPHVELNDFDNDGWPDLLTSASAGAGPAVFMHDGLVDGVPSYRAPDGLGDAQYWVAAPSVDYDRDGRLDVFLLEWEPALPSLLLRNETEAGNWVEVSVGGANAFGIGWRVEILDAGQLVGARDITVTQGYSAGVLPIAHFGLGDIDTVTIRLTPPGGDEIVMSDVAANQHVRWPAGCG